MEKLKNMEEVLYYLTSKEIVLCSLPHRTFFFSFQKERIFVRSNGMSCTLSLEEFKELYEGYDFYLYEQKTEEGIDLKKDEEYYQWRHK
mgnify:CR=1 FL=1|jgi:hypothetical protein